MNPVSLETTRRALAHIPAHDRDLWVRMAFAVKSEHGEEGFAAWDEWSRSADNYRERSAREVWRSAKPGNISIGTLLHEAKQRGFALNGEGARIYPAEIEQQRRECAEADTKAEAERRAQAVRWAREIWNAAAPARPDHRYLQRKGVAPTGTMREIEQEPAAEILGYSPKQAHTALTGRLLVLPVKINAQLSTLELIDEQGRKTALYGGAKAGGYWAADALPEAGYAGALLIGEGAATMLSARDATGFHVAAALSAGNLAPVAKRMREKYPSARLVILGDIGNGENKARNAATEAGAALALPDFGADRKPEQTDFNDLARARGAEAVKAQIEAAQSIAPPTIRKADGWPAPLEDAAYCGLAGEIVRAIEPQTESDPAAIMLQVLVAFGALVGRGPHVPIEGDEHHGNLFALIVGETSKARKGTSWGRVRQIFSRAQDWPQVVDGLSSGEGLKWAVRDRVTKTEKDDKGFAAEVEKDPGVTDKRVLIVEAEFAQVLRQAARAGNTLSATIRSAWDSGNLRTLTKNDPVTATGAHICIVGHITADELRAELTATDSANGFANRFLFMCAKRSKALPFGGNPLSPDTLSDFARRIAEAAGKAKAIGAVGMTPAARDAWEAVYGPLSEGYPGLFGAVTGRAEAQCLRLALVLALMDEAREIELAHLFAALAIWERAEGSARFIFGDAIGDAVADEILRALRVAGAAGMTRTDISKLLNKHQSAERIGAALELLERRGLARHESRPTPGAPVEIWRAT